VLRDFSAALLPIAEKLCGSTSLLEVGSATFLGRPQSFFGSTVAFAILTHLFASVAQALTDPAAFLGLPAIQLCCFAPPLSSLTTAFCGRTGIEHRFIVHWDEYSRGKQKFVGQPLTRRSAREAGRNKLFNILIRRAFGYFAARTPVVTVETHDSQRIGFHPAQL
jgi:hypothetical protein